MKPTSKPYIERLDIVRGIAILLVFFYHAQLDLYPEYVSPVYLNGSITVNSFKESFLQFNPAAYGWSGVTLFFIISGFLIHLGYLRNKERFNVLTFYSKRFWRIYPIYILVLLFFCFARNQADFYLNTSQGLFDFITHVFLVHNFWESTIYSINGAFWSLAVEFQLYLVYPVLLFVANRIGLKSSLIILFVLAVSARIILATEVVASHFINPVDMFINAWFTWCLGAYLAEKYMSEKKVIPFKSNGLLFLAFAIFIGSKYFLATGFFTQFFGISAWLIFMERLLYSKRNFNAWYYKVAVYIGLCSYSLYLIHQPVLSDLLHYYNINNVPLLKVMPVFAIIFLISYSLYLLIELKSVKVGNAIRNKRKLRSMAKQDSGTMNEALDDIKPVS